MSEANLFADFNKSTAAEWQEIIEKGLKGKSFDSLITPTAEGIPIQPFYHQDFLEKELHNISNPIQKENPGLPIRYWVNQYKISTQNVKEANQLALKVLNEGADGIIFQIKDNLPDLNILLNEIHPEFCMISFESIKPNFNFVQDYFHFLKAKNYNNSNITGAYFHDLLENRDGGLFNFSLKDFENLAQCIKAGIEYPQFKPLHISAQLYHNAGANINHELSFTLSKLAEYLDKLTDLGLEVKQVFNTISFSFAFGRHYFFEIAKTKAFKATVLKIASAYDLEISADDIIIHANTSKRSKSALDFNVNLLRNSTEAMAAILGGCNSLWVEPHDAVHAGQSKETFKRIALNVSTILKEEAYLDKIVDPTLGTYYLESIIKSLEEKSWEHFLNLEEHGSYSQLFEQGLISESIQSDEQKTSQEVAERKDLYIGANTFQLIGEKVELEVIKPTDSKFLSPKRATHKIESLRNRTESYVKKKGAESRPMATLVLLDTDPLSKAKSDFSYSFLGMAGIGIAEEYFLKPQENLAKKVKLFNSEVVVFCYKEKPDYLKDSLQNVKNIALIAGQEADEEELKSAGLYGCIHRKTSTLDFLNQLLTDLGIQ
ncbi:hypothetical protein JKA74_07610 [Marivirga sp. S37H4]|uniref:Methylmalonyl-CoA mutase alpha/beta chain catalytic domain-containing protein n=1 Tax=Marivirga aurantiaca TaxID=2802615 RepID=A0A934WXE8_9BACT|nr:methylmalonyl-CoA mutase family protein [Marivirga aurantiaca]MBK6264899.1 hypothetical protein [Marivirga aurantiaca]